MVGGFTNSCATKTSIAAFTRLRLYDENLDNDSSDYPDNQAYSGLRTNWKVGGDAGQLRHQPR